MWPLLDTIAEPDIPTKDKIMYITLVSRVHELSGDDNKDLHFVQERIEELFSSHLSRYEGLLFLYAVLKSNPAYYFSSWGKLIVPCLKCPDSYISQELSLRILNHIVKNFYTNKDSQKAFLRYIPDIIPILLAVDQNNKAFCLYCQSLALCMKKLPNILAVYKVEIVNFLMKHFDVFSTKTAVVIADCFEALPLCETYNDGKSTDNKYLNVWNSFFRKTLNTLQVILNDILHVTEADPSFVRIDPSEFFHIEYDNEQQEVSYVLSRARVFSSLCRCLANMVSAESCRVGVPVEDLLQCIGRIFHLKENVKLVEEFPKYKTFTLCYPIMQNSVFILLEALILNFITVEHGGNFARLIRDAVEISNLTPFTSSSMRQIRCSIWKVINIWLKQYGPRGSYDLVHDKCIIQELLKEIECESPSTKQSETQKSEAEFEPDECKIECCLTAIKVLKTIFLTMGFYLDADLTEVISSTVLKIVQIAQLQVNPLKPFPSPYCNQTCRKKIYDLLLASCLHGEHFQVKHVIRALNAFRNALKDPSLEVIQVGHKAFKLCRYFINPKKPPPESFMYSTVRREIATHPPPPEENIRTPWEDDNLNLSNGSSQSERFMDIPPPCQTETAFHTRDANEGQNNVDLLPAHSAASPNHCPEPLVDTQCNDDRNGLHADKPPSHSNIADESESDEDRIFCEEDNGPPTTLVLDIPQVITPQISLSNALEPQPSISESKIVELRPLQPIIPDFEKERSVKKYNDSDVHMNCSEEGEPEEEICTSSPKRISENGMDESEEESPEEEESDMDDEDEASECHSSENTPEQAIKRQKMNNEEEHSEEECEEDPSGQQLETGECEEDDNEVPKRSPTIREMCRDFVFAEPEEIS